MKKFVLPLIASLLAAVTLVSCSSGDDKTITVAASSTPHAEILEECKSILADEGYTLDIKVMDDYITPNTATDSGDVDANYFQHQPYLDSFNAENGTKLVTVAKIHYEPYGIYAGTVSSLDAIPDGAVIAVPNDTTNEARALLLLADNGLIELKDGAGLTATKQDIVSNPKNLDIREMEAALLPSVLDEVAVAVINGNYAIGAGLKVSEALAAEKSDSEAAQTYANILVVAEGHENDAKIKALADALQTDAVKEFINSKYDGAVVPIF
ncbi:MAG: MetQ/NlpA family ABC transporter substrate-binding protein [Eubacteriales bacterium]